MAWCAHYSGTDLRLNHVPSKKSKPKYRLPVESAAGFRLSNPSITHSELALILVQFGEGPGEIIDGSR